MSRSAAVALLLTCLAVPHPSLAQQAADQPVLKGAAACGDWRADAPGVRRLIRPEDLPAPFASKSSSNGPRGARMPKSPHVSVPPGFTATLWAQNLEEPREIKVAPNGDVFVAETSAGRIRVIRPGENGTVRREDMHVYASGLDGPFGMAFYPPAGEPHWLYVATETAVQRFAYKDGDLEADGRSEMLTNLRISEGGHSTRDLAFSADSRQMFVSVGSQSNDAESLAPLSPGTPFPLPKGAAWGDEERRADVLVFDPDGKNGRVFATGIRNCVGLARKPGSDDLYCATNERDGLGDNLPPDYVTRVPDGAFFGWPWFYTGGHVDPRHKNERPDLADRVSVPDVLIQPHSAPLGIAFYPEPSAGPASFDARYAGAAFVTLHGSWNRSQRTGYKVVAIEMRDGAPTGVYEDFLTGFVNPDGSVWGRPVGVAVAKDGALLVSEDAGGTIWRIAPDMR